jgi:hypothetical protein
MALHNNSTYEVDAIDGSCGTRGCDAKGCNARGCNAKGCNAKGCNAFQETGNAFSMK